MTNKSELQERIKELTCLYEVSSIIVNADSVQLEVSFQAIAFSLKKAFQSPEKTTITIETQFANAKTAEVTSADAFIKSNILTFNEPKGKIVANKDGSNLETNGFLNEEQLLLDNIALKIGSLWNVSKLKIASFQ